jgi:hypothetical protein
MKHTIEVINRVRFVRPRTGCRLELKIDGVPVSGLYLVARRNNSNHYVLRLNNGVSKHPDWKNLRAQVLEALNVYKQSQDTMVMSPELWRYTRKERFEGTP